ncbi:MAG: metallophosphoesterase family protein [Bacillota bacterium]
MVISADYRYDTKMDIYRRKKTKKNALPDYRFIVMGDSRGKDEGVNEEIFRALLNEIMGLYPEPDYIMFSGDLVSGSRKSKELKAQLKKFKEIFTDYFPIEILLPTVGNHEVGSNPEDDTREKIFAKVYSEFEADEFLKGYNRTAYYVDVGDVRLIALNSYHPGESNQITGRQLEWFRRVVREPKKHKLVFLHAPAYPVGQHIGSSLDAYPEERDRFWDIIDKNHVGLVFAGHEHNYSRRRIDKSFSTEAYQFQGEVDQIVAGGAGAPLRDTFADEQGVIVPPIAAYHYVIVDVYGEDLYVKAVSVDGDIIDEFIIKHH